MASQESSLYTGDVVSTTPSPNDGAEDALQVPGTSRLSIPTSRRASTCGRSQRSHSTVLTVEDANKLMAEALAIQERHDLPAGGASGKSSVEPTPSEEDGNQRLSVGPEAHYATASNYNRSRRSLSVVAEDPNVIASTTDAAHLHPREVTTYPSPRYHNRRTAIHTSLPSWTRYPSHTRPSRSASATDAGILIRDFADPSFRRNATANISQFPQQTYRETLKHLAKNCTSVAKYYATRLTSPQGYRGVNRRTSVSVAKGGVREPELEMIALSPGAGGGGSNEGAEGGGGAEEMQSAAVVGREEHRQLIASVERELGEDDEEEEEEEEEGEEKEKRCRAKGKGNGKGGLKLDLSRARGGETAFMRADSGFEGLEGARLGTPFVVEKMGFDWGGGFAAGGGERKEMRSSGGFEFSFQKSSSRRKQDGVGPKSGSGEVIGEDEEEQAP
ncbi:hypothetical protein BST61_g3738 [Cercospora zeina]